MRKVNFGKKNWNKYGAKKTIIDGYRFDSKAEAKRYGELKLLCAAGDIQQLQVQPSYDLNLGRNKPRKYTADFSYIERGGREVIEDVKGYMTRDAALRIWVFEGLYGKQVTIIGKRRSKGRGKAK